MVSNSVTDFFFSVESLTLTKNDHITIRQRVKIIKTYYKKRDSVTGTYRVLIGYFMISYDLHIPPTTQAIGKIVKKF